MDDCVICQKTVSGGEQTVTLTQQGCDGILKASEARGKDITVAAGQSVHVKRRSDYTNPRSILYHKRKLSGEQDHHLQHTLRLKETTFSYVFTCVSDATCIDADAENNLLSSLTKLLEGVLSGSISPADVENNEILSTLGEKVVTEKNMLVDNRTATLWLQYMDMIDLLRRFIKAERLGNWELHLQCLYDMLPYLAASRHNLYVKSVHVYLQKMSRLEEDLPDVHKYFMDGCHVVRRSDRLWAGISTDLAIEQCLMRSLKTSGGLTRGRGLTETQRLIWILSTPSCAEINSAMQNFTGVTFTTSEQHKETSHARMTKDHSDIQELLQYLVQRNPFSTDGPKSLRNIATGVTAHPTVNWDNAKHVGQQILQSMVGRQEGG